MDTTGNNRYELLFMEDDGGAPAPVETITKKKQRSPKPTASIKKQNLQTEKENKADTLNKSDSRKKDQSARPKQGLNAAVGVNKSRLNGTNEDGSRREQRNNRRNLRDGAVSTVGGGDFNNEQRQQRQFRERENRGPPRNRLLENGFRGKREFDRQSGSDKTGVKAIDKRDGAGAHNWGSVKQEIDDVNKSTNDGDAVLTDKEESGIDQVAEQVTTPEEEETKEMTLDEWKAMRQQRAKPQFNIRKAGEGEDTSQWKKMIVLNKKKEGDSEEELEYDPSMYPQRVGRLQRIVDIQFNFNDGRRGGGFGRGRGRGSRTGPDRTRFENGRGNGSGETNRVVPGRSRNFGERQRGGSNQLKVDDELQFPTLS